MYGEQKSSKKGVGERMKYVWQTKWRSTANLRHGDSGRELLPLLAAIRDGD